MKNTHFQPMNRKTKCKTRSKEINSFFFSITRFIFIFILHPSTCQRWTRCDAILFEADPVDECPTNNKEKSIKFLLKFSFHVRVPCAVCLYLFIRSIFFFFWFFFSLTDEFEVLLFISTVGRLLTPLVNIHCIWKRANQFNYKGVLEKLFEMYSRNVCIHRSEMDRRRWREGEIEIGK